MSRQHLREEALSPPIIGPDPRRYFIVRRQDEWMIDFEGEQFGPYKTEREALLFAVDAAHKLGQQGEATEVLQRDENGETRPKWSYGRDPYPAAF